MKKVKYKEFELSKFALGTVQLGLDYGIANSLGKPNYQDAKEIVRFAQKSGINSFDTASAYNDSEYVLGKSLDHKKDFYIVSKMSSDDFIEDAKFHLDKSLKKLKADKLFGLLLHDSKLLSYWDKSHQQIVKDLRSSKKIDFFGVSIYNDEDFNLALENQFIEIIQIPFNIFDNRAIKKKWLKRAKEKEKLIFIRSIYLQGLLLMDIDNIPPYLKSVEPYLKLLDNFCESLSLSRQELVLSYIDAKTDNEIVLFGCERLKQIKENVKIFDNISTLDQVVLEDIEKSFKSISQDIYNPSRWKL